MRIFSYQESLQQFKSHWINSKYKAEKNS